MPDLPSPLVSVLVRSLDRPFLRAALDSVAAQSYPYIELVVVAARPGHAALPECVGRVPLRLLATEQPRLRSAAANAALDAARGEYLLFLDDDDWLLPDHVGRLVQALQALPSTLAAYAGVALVDVQGQPLGQVFDLPFDAVRQLSGNLTPIHAVLFSARLRERGCRFDETLDRYEDWDFWIQLARHTVMAHVPGVSAVYRVHASSGVHDDAGADSESSRRIQHKWLQRSTPQQLGDLMRRAWACDDLAHQVHRERAEAERLRATSAAHEQAYRQLMPVMIEQASTVERLRDEAGQQAAQVARQAEAVERLTQEVQAGRGQAGQLTAALDAERQLAAELARQLAERSFRLEQAQADHAAVLASTSWRLTAPLRALANRLRGRAPGR